MGQRPKASESEPYSPKGGEYQAEGTEAAMWLTAGRNSSEASAAGTE